MNETLANPAAADVGDARDERAMPGWLRWLTLLAALVGLAVFCSTDWTIVLPRRSIGFSGSRRWLVIGGAIVCAGCSFIPLFFQAITRVGNRLARPTPRGRRVTTLIVFAVATGYLLLTARLQGRDFTMNIQDEMMYLVQARMLSHGHLWYLAHPLADFFQELLTIIRPVYASMYFPGTALLYAPTLWLSIPNWLLAAMVAGGVVAMIYRVVAEVADGTTGLLVAMLFVAINSFRWMSIMVMSHPLLLLQGLLMFWSLLHWRRSRRAGWMAAFGFFAGWAGITRPLDALAFGVPLFVWIVVELYRRPRGDAWKALGAMALAAAPLLAVQLIFDKGVTGRWLQTPVQYFHAHYFPRDFVPSHPGDLPPNLRDAPEVFKHYYTDFLMKQEVKYRSESLWTRFPAAIRFGVPATWLYFFLPAGVLALRERRYWPFAAVFLAFVVGYMTFAFFLPHYIVIIAPMTLLFVVLGAKQMAKAAGRFGPRVACFFGLVLAGTALACLPEFGRVKDEPRVSLPMKAFNHAEPSLARPALVFFRSFADDAAAWRHEQVYNQEGAPIDDSPVIRARDLGARNIELVRYYGKIQPERTVYFFHQEACVLQKIGTVAQICDHPELLDVPELHPAPARKETAADEK